MREHKQFLYNKLNTFFEDVKDQLKPYLAPQQEGQKDFTLIKVDDSHALNLWGKEDEEFQKPEIDGYMFDGKQGNSIKLIQKINLSNLAEKVNSNVDDVKEAIESFIKPEVAKFEIFLETEPSIGGYYKLNKILSKNTETDGDVVYLVMKLLLDKTNIGKSETDSDDEKIMAATSPEEGEEKKSGSPQTGWTKHAWKMGGGSSKVGEK